MAGEKAPLPGSAPPDALTLKGDVTHAIKELQKLEDDSSQHRAAHGDQQQQGVKEDDTVMRVGYYKMKGELMKKYPTAPRVKYVYLPKSELEKPHFTFDQTFEALGITIPNVLFKFHGTFDPKEWNCRLPERPERCPDACVTLFRKQLFPFNGYPDRVRFSDLSAAFAYVNNKFPECLKRNTLKAAFNQWRTCPIMRTFSHIYGREYVIKGKGKVTPPAPLDKNKAPAQPEEEKEAPTLKRDLSISKSPLPAGTIVPTTITGKRRPYPGDPPWTCPYILPLAFDLML